MVCFMEFHKESFDVSVRYGVYNLGEEGVHLLLVSVAYILVIVGGVGKERPKVVIGIEMGLCVGVALVV